MLAWPLVFMKMFKIMNTFLTLSFVEAEQSDEQLHQEISQVGLKKNSCGFFFGDNFVSVVYSLT